MRYDDRTQWRYRGGTSRETADAEFAAMVESVGPEPGFFSGRAPAYQRLDVRVTDVRRGDGVAADDYMTLDVLIVRGKPHVRGGSSGIPALDSSMVQAGVTIVAWANLTAEGWRAIEISTDGPVPASNYAGRYRGADRHATRGYPNPNRYGRPYATGLDTLDLTDYPTNVFVIIPDTDTPTVPRQIRQSDHDALERGWDRMMRGRGLTIDGPVQNINGVDVDLASRFRELLRGGLADSPIIRSLFLEIVNDDAHPLTFHIVHDAVGIFIDGFQFNPNVDRRVTPLPHRGHHTFDMDDFDQTPRVSGNPRNDMRLSLQNLLHGLREARQGVLFAGAGDAYPSSHLRAMADENLFRQEQGQRGALFIGATPLTSAPVITPIGNGHIDIRWEFRANNGTGPVEVAETWDHFTDGTGRRHIASIDYFPN